MQIKRGAIVWANLDGKGSEQRGYRPCIVVQNEAGNTFSKTTIIVPLTKLNRHNGHLPTHLIIKAKDLDYGLSDSVVLTEQIKVVDKDRIKKTRSIVSDRIMNSIEEKILVSLGITA